MILTRGKIVIIAIAIAIVATLIGFVAAANRESGEFEKQVTITLKGVNMTAVDQEKNVMMMRVDFNVLNRADKTLTIAKMDYELFGNGKSLGVGFFSAEDISLGGRPGLFSHMNTTITSDFSLKYSDNVKDLWNLLVDKASDKISWKVKGTAQIESALSLGDVPFESAT